MSQSTKINNEESEKLKELVRTVKNLETASEEAIKGGGAKIEDEMLERAKRVVSSYKIYLAGKYGGEPESYNVSLDEKQEGAKTEPTTVKAGESGPEKATTKTHSPDVANF
jgi:hypothetical protein